MDTQQTPAQAAAHFRGLAQTYRDDARRATNIQDEARRASKAETLEWAAEYLTRFVVSGSEASHD